MKRYVRLLAIALIIVIVAMQCIRPERANPSADRSMAIDQQSGIPPSVAALVRTSCYDCHSNETRWPWYSEVAPVSWLVADDVRSGRQHLNFSEWGSYTKSKRVLKLGEIYEQVTKNEMPLSNYIFMHPKAKLSPAERDSISNWTEDETARLTGGN